MLAALMLRMAQHPYANHYWASMAIAGQRGTLRNLWRGTELDGRFRGKTGTISGVRSISGVLETTSADTVMGRASYQMKAMKVTPYIPPKNKP